MVESLLRHRGSQVSLNFLPLLSIEKLLSALADEAGARGGTNIWPVPPHNFKGGDMSPLSPPVPTPLVS